MDKRIYKNAVFRDCKIKGDYSQCVFEHCEFIECELDDLNLKFTVFKDCKFSRCEITGYIELNGSIFMHCHFKVLLTPCDSMAYADYENAVIANCQFITADLGAIYSNVGIRIFGNEFISSHLDCGLLNYWGSTDNTYHNCDMYDYVNSCHYDMNYSSSPMSPIQ